MTVRLYPELEQGSLEWYQARCGLLTASEMKHVITAKTLKASVSEKATGHLYELLGQRITGYVEPAYISDHMLRGQEDEIEARLVYSKTYASVTEVGFITNDRWGFTLGYSPDGLVGADGQIECKSRLQKYQVQTIVENVDEGTSPDDFAIQVQTGLLVSERQWCDLVSYCGGLPMATIRVYPIPEVQEAILEAAHAFEQRLAECRRRFDSTLAGNARLIPTERKIFEEMTL